MTARRADEQRDLMTQPLLPVAPLKPRRGRIARPHVPVDADPLARIAFEIKCERALPAAPAATPADDLCVRWAGPFARYDLRKPEDRDAFTRVNGAPVFLWRKRRYAARNVAFAMVRHDPRVLAGTRGRNVRLSSTCGRPYCVNPWHHRLCARRKRKPAAAADRDDDVAMAEAPET